MIVYKWQMMKSIRANEYCRKFVHGKCPLTGVASKWKQNQLVPGEYCITTGNIAKLVVEWPFWVSVTIFLARWQVYLGFELTILNKYIKKMFIRCVPFFFSSFLFFCFPTFSTLLTHTHIYAIDNHPIWPPPISALHNGHWPRNWTQAIIQKSQAPLQLKKRHHVVVNQTKRLLLLLLIMRNPIWLVSQAIQLE